MTKADVVKKLHEKLGEKHTMTDCAVCFDTIVDAMSEGIQTEGGITLHGFGTFKVVERSARKGRNPQTGETVNIPAHKAVKFTASKSLKGAVADS